MDLNFRDLRADEIDCRVSQISEKGLSLLLYKDARCDMNILDETVGPMGWQRRHSRDNANCTVSILDKDTGVWIEKEDTGTESNTEAEKGLASDSFKRACFNWGLGRELYTAPHIWIDAGKYEAYQKNDKKWATYDTFSVTDIEVKDKKIVGLVIKNNKTNTFVFSWGTLKSKAAVAKSQAAKVQKKAATAPTAPVAPAMEVPAPVVAATLAPAEVPDDEARPWMVPDQEDMSCQRCHNLITDVKLKNGGVMSAAQVRTFGLQKFPDWDGGLCAKCQAELIKVRKQEG